MTVWVFGKTGAKTLHSLYEQLVARLDIDAIILIDGGIDSLTKEGAFLGSYALLKQMPVHSEYEAACRYVWDQPGQTQGALSPMSERTCNGSKLKDRLLS